MKKQNNPIISFTGVKDVKEMERVLKPAEDLMQAFNIPAIIHVYYQCDNPKCKYRVEVPRAEAVNFHFCPKCGVKEGKFPPLHARKVSKK